MDYKTCTKCSETLPATHEYFHRAPKGKYGFRAFCKSCWQKYYRKNQSRILEKATLHRKENPEYMKQWRIENREHIARYNKEYYDPIRRRQHLEDNRERDRRVRRAYYQDHRGQKKSYSSKWWKSTNGRQKSRIYRIRRRARMVNLPNTFNEDDWGYAICYFNGRCAVCERPLNDLFNTHKAHADHWIPINSPDCPGTIPTNIVPLCGGEGGCNNSKNDKLAVDWLAQKYGKRKSVKIVRRIQKYFDSLGTNRTL